MLGSPPETDVLGVDPNILVGMLEGAAQRGGQLFRGVVIGAEIVEGEMSGIGKIGPTPEIDLKRDPGVPVEGLRYSTECAHLGLERVGLLFEVGGMLRERNGYPEPHNVKYWGIGNEVTWARGKGNFTPAEYASLLEEYVTLMKRVDPTIKIVAVGIRLESTAARKAPKWNERLETVLKHAMDLGVAAQRVHVAGDPFWRLREVPHIHQPPPSDSGGGVGGSRGWNAWQTVTGSPTEVRCFGASRCFWTLSPALPAVGLSRTTPSRRNRGSTAGSPGVAGSGRVGHGTRCGKNVKVEHRHCRMVIIARASGGPATCDGSDPTHQWRQILTSGLVGHEKGLLYFLNVKP